MRTQPAMLERSCGDNAQRPAPSNDRAKRGQRRYFRRLQSDKARRPDQRPAIFVRYHFTFPEKPVEIRRCWLIQVFSSVVIVAEPGRGGYVFAEIELHRLPDGDFRHWLLFSTANRNLRWNVDG